MNIVDEILGFFKRLMRQHVNTAQSRVNQKVRSAQVKAQSKAANAVNNKIKEGTNKAKGAAASKMAKKDEKKA